MTITPVNDAVLPADEWKLSADMALEVASHEAVIRQAYKDSVGVWTWSVGLTSATGHDVERYIDKPQTLETCMAVYVWALEKYFEDVKKRFGKLPMKKSEITAALSFHWNTGKIKTAGWPKLLIDGKKTAARQSFLTWMKPKSLKERRTREADLLFDGKWHNKGTMTEYTKLTLKHTPVWSSAILVDVKDILIRQLNTPGEQVVVVPDSPPIPPIIQPKPTLTPTAAPGPDPEDLPPPLDINKLDTYSTSNAWERFKIWIASLI